jgi:hypothetical protein
MGGRKKRVFRGRRAILFVCTARWGSSLRRVPASFGIREEGWSRGAVPISERAWSCGERRERVAHRVAGRRPVWCRVGCRTAYGVWRRSRARAAGTRIRRVGLCSGANEAVAAHFPSTDLTYRDELPRRSVNRASNFFSWGRRRAPRTPGKYAAAHTDRKSIFDRRVKTRAW